MDRRVDTAASWSSDTGNARGHTQSSPRPSSARRSALAPNAKAFRMTSDVIGSEESRRRRRASASSCAACASWDIPVPVRKRCRMGRPATSMAKCRPRGGRPHHVVLGAIDRSTDASSCSACAPAKARNHAKRWRQTPARVVPPYRRFVRYRASRRTKASCAESCSSVAAGNVAGVTFGSPETTSRQAVD